MINLDKHKLFDFETKQEVVPLAIAKKAVQEAFDIANEKIGNNMEAVMKGVADSMTQINKAVNETLKDD
jgi:PHP family Zn ribbon phosphoesterase